MKHERLRSFGQLLFYQKIDTKARISRFTRLRDPSESVPARNIVHDTHTQCVVGVFRPINDHISVLPRRPGVPTEIIQLEAVDHDHFVVIDGEGVFEHRDVTCEPCKYEKIHENRTSIRSASSACLADIPQSRTRTRRQTHGRSLASGVRPRCRTYDDDVRRTLERTSVGTTLSGRSGKTISNDNTSFSVTTRES